MRALLLLNLATLRGKYWLIPALMALGAAALSFGMVTLDAQLGARWSEEVPWLYLNGPTGARALLSTIAGSMITVAGVTFSVTIVAITTTTTTFGPRLTGNFMRDRGNQITLGTFIATFLFCILVLRTVQSPGEGETFVPHLAVAVGLLLAVANIAVLIYFMHHVPESLHIANVVASLGRELIAQVDELFPEEVGRPARTSSEPAEAAPRGWRARTVEAGHDGYVRYVDGEDLVRQAQRHDLFVTLHRRPGDFVAARDAIATVRAARPPSDEALHAVRGTVVVGTFRSREQDLSYGLDRLVEVAARALSPGMNDVFTALNAIDWLGGALCRLVRREFPAGHRCDEEGGARVAAPAPGFAEVVGHALDQLRPYVAADRNAAIQTMRMLGGVVRHAGDPGRRAVLRAQAEALRALGHDKLDDPQAREALREAFEDVAAALDAPAGATDGA